MREVLDLDCELGNRFLDMDRYAQHQYKKDPYSILQYLHRKKCFVTRENARSFDSKGSLSKENGPSSERPDRLPVVMPNDFSSIKYIEGLAT